MKKLICILLIALMGMTAFAEARAIGSAGIR